MAMTTVDGGVRRIINASGDVFMIWWSADGRRLFEEDFFSSGGGGRSTRWRTGLEEGRPPERERGGSLTRGACFLSLARGGVKSGGERGGGPLVGYRARGGGAKEREGGDRLAGWSPDSRSILFHRLSDVYSIDADGTDLRQLTSDGASQAMDWSPDGELVLFLRSVASGEKPPHERVWELWVMDADGGRQTRLPFNRPKLEVIAADWSTS